jgi:hypothetical protein
MTPFILGGIIIDNANILVVPGAVRPLGRMLQGLKLIERPCALTITNSISMPILCRQRTLRKDSEFKHSARIGSENQTESAGGCQNFDRLSS